MVLKSFPVRSLRNMYLESRRLLVQAPASCVDGVEDFGHDSECVGSRGATQVCYSQTLWEDRAINIYHAFL
ncbi:hypothetical protein TIFTF001_054139 [Ficus carica]|uniref:Uncharacterized protein n=1 Tax=Ficus carica TaxID=3494 RepID=A0AA88EBY3_FICCA|nr:hypothetical protein TIFTF001_054139 [Ficus carica]